MIRKIIRNRIINSGPSSSVLSAAFLITAAGVGSRALGLVRDRFLAGTFGAGDALDIYYAAFRIPDLIYNLVILGALSAAFIPVFTSLISKDKENEAWDLASGILSLSAFCIVVFSVVFCLLAPELMKVITPGFGPEKMAKTVFFTRIMFLSPLFLGISGVFGGILTSYKKFLVYSLAPIFYNLGIIIGVVFLVPFFGPAGLAWGVALGAFLHMASQYPAVRHSGFRFHFGFLRHFRDNNIKKTIRLMIPRAMGIAVNQINLFVITIFASTLAAGSLAVFNFAQNLQSVPLGIFGVSFAIAAFPTLASMHAKEDKNNFIRHFSETFRQIMFFVIPLSIFILLLRAQIVRVVLGSGKFDWEDTTLTFEALGIFALSLFAQSVIPLLARSFYAMHDTKTPFLAALATEAVNIAAVVLLIGRFEVLGLVIAFSISALVQMFILLFVLRLRFENLDDKKILASISKIAFASFLAGVGIQGAKYLTAGFVDMDTFFGVFVQLFLSGLFGTAIFLAISYIIKLEELLRLIKSFKKRVFRNKKAIVEDIDQVAGI